MVLKAFFLAAICVGVSHQAYARIGISAATSCDPRRESDKTPLRLIYSQKDNDANEFSVGWNLYEDFVPSITSTLRLGDDIGIYRCLPPGRYVLIAKGHVTQLNGQIVEAFAKSTLDTSIVLGKPTAETIESRNLVWRPMVGDEVIPLHNSFQTLRSISPIVHLGNELLFVKGEGNEMSFSLSAEGQNLLREKFELFKNANGRLEIKGFALVNGDPEKLRTDTLMRAQTVSSFLIREFSLKPEQVVPVGYGNDWLQMGMQTVAQHGNVQEGIVLKVLNN